MDVLYIKNNFFGVVLQIFEFLNPPYICSLEHRREDSSRSFACTAKYFANLRQKYIAAHYRKCAIQNILKPICRTHCKAFPIHSLVYKKLRAYLKNRGQFIHFEKKNIADFLPHIAPYQMILGKRCCSGKGWEIRRINVMQLCSRAVPALY